MTLDKSGAHIFLTEEEVEALGKLLKAQGKTEITIFKTGNEWRLRIGRTDSDGHDFLYFLVPDAG